MSRRTDEKAFLDRMKDVLSEQKEDFTEAEWSTAIRKAVTGGETVKPRWTAVVFKPVFAYGLAVLLVGAAVLFGVRRFPWLVPAVENRLAISSDGAAAAAGQMEIIRPIDPVIDPAAWYAQANKGQSSKPTAGDVPTLTWISQETGLQIVWFVNDNLDMED